MNVVYDVYFVDIWILWFEEICAQRKDDIKEIHAGGFYYGGQDVIVLD